MVKINGLGFRPKVCEAMGLAPAAVSDVHIHVTPDGTYAEAQMISESGANLATKRFEFAGVHPLDMEFRRALCRAMRLDPGYVSAIHLHILEGGELYADVETFIDGAVAEFVNGFAFAELPEVRA